ncbi:MAG TPA: outer membrane beta-barrel protein, partial [Sphingomicrobium sp.]
GGDVTRPLAGGALKFVGLATRRSRETFDGYIARDGFLDNGAAIVGGFDQFQDAKQGETIGRLSWTRSDLAGLSFEIGAEAVLNTLDSEVQLFGIDAGGNRNRIDLPIDEAEVKEKRGEVYVRVGKTLSPALRIDAGVNYEMSKLTVTGDANEERTLKFLKPSLSIDWTPGGGWRTRLALRRTVAQLNFFDFISIAELSNDRVNGGNAELQPQRTWEARATVEKPILGDGLVKLDLGHDRISMLQDQILTPEGFSAPGNLGSGKRSFASLTVDAPLGSFGLTGTRLKLFGQLQNSKVDDPISGQSRRFSDFFPEWQWNVEMRRDSGDFSYGFTVSDRDRFSFFRANEIDTNWNGGPYGTAFVEYRPADRTSVTVDVDNAFNTHAYRRRTFFTPNRSSQQPSSVELRERNRHVGVSLTLKQTFGGGGGGGGGSARVAQFV